MDEALQAVTFAAIFAVIGFFLRDVYNRWMEVRSSIQILKLCIQLLSTYLKQDPKISPVPPLEVTHKSLAVIASSVDFREIYTEYCAEYTSWLKDEYLVRPGSNNNSAKEGLTNKVSSANDRLASIEKSLNGIGRFKLMIALRIQ